MRRSLQIFSNPGAGRVARRAAHRRGTTLIEVLAGLVVLATLLVSVGMARARFLRQWAEADRKLQVIRSTDRLLGTWMSGPAEAVPVASEGALENVPKCVWRTRVLDDPAAAKL